MQDLGSPLPSLSLLGDLDLNAPHAPPTLTRDVRQYHPKYSSAPLLTYAARQPHPPSHSYSSSSPRPVSTDVLSTHGLRPTTFLRSHTLFSPGAPFQVSKRGWCWNDGAWPQAGRTTESRGPGSQSPTPPPLGCTRAEAKDLTPEMLYCEARPSGNAQWGSRGDLQGRGSPLTTPPCPPTPSAAPPASSQAGRMECAQPSFPWPSAPLPVPNAVGGREERSSSPVPCRPGREANEGPADATRRGQGAAPSAGVPGMGRRGLLVPSTGPA